MEQKKEGRENKVLKSGGKLGQVVGALKKKGGGGASGGRGGVTKKKRGGGRCYNLLTNYELRK